MQLKMMTETLEIDRETVNVDLSRLVETRSA